MKIARAQLDEILAHAHRDLPNECCGAVGARDGVVTKVYPLKNVAASPYRFEIGVDMYAALTDIEDGGAELAAIYHSHPRTEAYPSLTDMAWSEQYPGAEWIIVGHVETSPVVRSFRVTKQDVEEVPLEVE
jgi:proteasome lid subunit RPN8/RPN11